MLLFCNRITFVLFKQIDSLIIDSFIFFEFFTGTLFKIQFLSTLSNGLNENNWLFQAKIFKQSKIVFINASVF